MKANKQTKQASFRSVLYIISVNLRDRTGEERKRQTIINAFPRISAWALSLFQILAKRMGAFSKEIAYSGRRLINFFFERNREWYSCSWEDHCI